MAEKKFVVADGVSFVGNKKTYKAGDEIDKSAFKDEKRFSDLIAKKKIVEAPAAETAAPKKDRNELEKIAIEKGGLKKEQVSSMKDEELEKYLKEKELLK